MAAMIDMTGQRFGRLTVIERAPNRASGPNATRARWRCGCSCGGEAIVDGPDLRRGMTTSCGCAKREAIIARNTRHGHAARGNSTPEYVTWSQMLARCNSPGRDDWRHYGGRGIAVCERWRIDFAAFLADMGPRPSAKHSIERIDGDGAYEPGNCVWATQTEQMRNTKRTRRIEFRGETFCMKEWAGKLGLPYLTLYTRLTELGWSVERAFTTPRGG